MSDNLYQKKERRRRRKARIRGKIVGSAERLRLSIFRSNRYIYLQAIDDQRGQTCVAASTLEKELRSCRADVQGGQILGKLMGERLLAHNAKTVVFDRNGYSYHGVVKAVVEAVREQGVSL